MIMLDYVHTMPHIIENLIILLLPNDPRNGIPKVEPNPLKDLLFFKKILLPNMYHIIEEDLCKWQ